MRQAGSYEDFEEMLLNEHIPDIDYEASRKMLSDRINSHIQYCKTRRVKNKIILVIAAALLVVPAYAVTHMIFPEFGSHSVNLRTLFKMEDEEMKHIKERRYSENEYIKKTYAQIITEREELIEPDTYEVLIVPANKTKDDAYITYPIFKPEIIRDYDVMAALMAGLSEIPEKLPGNFIFSEGEVRHVYHLFIDDNEKKSLYEKAQEEGEDYAIKKIVPTDEIDFCRLKFERLTSKEDKMTLFVSNQKATYLLMEDWKKETIDHNGITIFFFEISTEGNSLENVYHFEKNGRPYALYASPNLDREDILTVIDYIMEQAPPYNANSHLN